MKRKPDDFIEISFFLYILWCVCFFPSGSWFDSISCYGSIQWTAYNAFTAISNDIRIAKHLIEKDGKKNVRLVWSLFVTLQQKKTSLNLEIADNEALQRGNFYFNETSAENDV